MYNFMITEPKNMRSLIYSIDKKKDDYVLREIDVELVNDQNLIGDSEYTVKKYSNVNRDDNLIIISMWDDKVSVNAGIIEGEVLRISKVPKGLRYRKVSPEEIKKQAKYKYSSNKDKKVFIIDLETAKEITINEVLENEADVESCEISIGKQYLAIEYRHGEVRVLAVGVCKFEDSNGKLEAVMAETEARRVNYDKMVKEIIKGNYKEIRIEKQKEREI